MPRWLLPLTLLALASCSTQQEREKQAIHMTVANRSQEPQALEEMWVSLYAVRIHHDLGPDGTPKRITLARMDKGLLYELDPAAKTYSEVRFDWLAAKMDKGDGPQYQVQPYEFTTVSGQRVEGYIVLKEGRGVGKIWVSRDIERENSTSMAWRVYHRFRGFTGPLMQVPGVIVKQDFEFPDYAYESEAQSVNIIEEPPLDLFELPQGFEKKASEER